VTISLRPIRQASAAALVVAVFALAFAASCGGGEPAPTAQPSPTPSPLTLVDGGQGGVTIQVTWVTPDLMATPEMDGAGEVDLSRFLAFYVRMDSQSTDLSKYDPSRVSVLRPLNGGEYEPQSWILLNVADDHRDGLLVFPKVDLGGGGVELVFRGVGGVPERSYRWFTPPGG
jgi:hypothetical protein